MSKKSFSVLCLITILLPVLFLHAYGRENFRLPSYGETINLAGEKKILFIADDRPEYALCNYDDSRWQRVSLPHNWNNTARGHTGVSWYRMHITFPATTPHNSIGISLGTIIDADEIYFNGVLVGKSGSINPKRSSYDKKRLYELPTSLIIPGQDNVVALRIAGIFPERNGPYKGEFSLGQYGSLYRQFLSVEFFNIIWIILYALFSLYLLFFAFRDMMKRGLYLFFFLTVMAGIYFTLRSQLKYLLFDDFPIMKKIEYISLFFVFILSMEFIATMFSRKRKLYQLAFYILMALCSAFMIYSDDPNQWHLVLYYIVQPSWIIPLLYISHILVKEVKVNRNARPVLISTILLWCCVMNDILVHHGVYQFISIANYGYLVLVISVAVIIKNHYYRMSFQVQEQPGARENSGINLSLKTKIDEAISIIKNNYHTEISREDIARQVGLNPDYLGKMFIRYTGKKFYHYCNEIRVSEASRQLRESDVKIIEIANDVGFESMTTFYRVFRESTGMSPREYRLMHRPDSASNLDD